MVLFETLKCENSLARKNEKEYLEQIGATLNKERPYRNEQELKECTTIGTRDRKYKEITTKTQRRAA